MVPSRRSAADRASAEAVAAQFLAAGVSGNLDQLIATLAPDVVVTSDGGGLVHAAMRPVVGVDRVARFLLNLVQRTADDLVVVRRQLNGVPGVIVHAGGSWSAWLIEVRQGRVAAIRTVASPAKLERLVAALPEAAGLAGVWDTPARFRHRGGRRVPSQGRTRPVVPSRRSGHRGQPST